ncbi:MAG: methylenetetrahydrofolate--tRNA-(uracil(54)-C(5))-methyltransferase (FADH(2)-oxidizing) TrmFO [Acidobacteria bacterium]|nr:MAG: methylenetetrahydrofolate--tRNA-(uracil(54)-C(5))-methyltransferase (FADH(2)-oxidizing) TrmFO [Acidobacteriota bacterium]PYQ67362.1 MAG: methylenetetrahydrofolate--tRNA-(uracil(54)-C(5))-methyltransferase (FADH(2)-oxidizing) TrmFO [Acidobacteriota bacterium]
MKDAVTVVGAGLAGSECAWQLARRGHRVRLFEMRPKVRTAAHQTERCAELVCSNSFRSDNPRNAVGLLKREMELLDSLVIRCARAAAVPAGDALAMDRDEFSRLVTESIASRPEIEIVREEVSTIPSAGHAVLATGPLTSDALDRAIGELLGTEDLYFYDSMAPIVAASSLDFSKMYPLSRYGKGSGEDYWNCPLTREEYEGFVANLLSAEIVPVKDFEKGIYFEGCLPIEVMAERGVETLRHGPMKPMGLPDPRTGRIPWAVVQLRQDDLAKEHYNLVGFQTKLKVAEQQRVFRRIPGLENAAFVRYGMLHRNTYIHAPAHLDRFWRMRREPRLFFAGQITGVEGYVESAATGLAVGITIAQLLEGREPVPIPYTTAIGSLARHCSERPRTATFEPMNVTFGLIEDTSHSPVRDKAVRRQQMVDRALAGISQWKEATAARETVAAS